MLGPRRASLPQQWNITVNEIQLTLVISTSLISKWKSGPCLNMKMCPKEQFLLFSTIFSIYLEFQVQLHIHLLNVVVRFSFSSILQFWYVGVRISRSISESPLEFEYNNKHSNEKILSFQWHLKPEQMKTTSKTTVRLTSGILSIVSQKPTLWKKLRKKASFSLRNDLLLLCNYRRRLVINLNMVHCHTCSLAHIIHVVSYFFYEWQSFLNVLLTISYLLNLKRWHRKVMKGMKYP